MCLVSVISCERFCQNYSLEDFLSMPNIKKNVNVRHKKNTKATIVTGYMFLTYLGEVMTLKK